MTYKVKNELASMIAWMSNYSKVQQLELPPFTIGYKARDMDGAGLEIILGNDLIKRFNLVFDNRNGRLYVFSGSPIVRLAFSIPVATFSILCPISSADGAKPLPFLGLRLS